MLNAEKLAHLVAEKIEEEIDVFPRHITTVFGQNLEVVDQHGDWADDLKIEHVGYTVRKFPWKRRMHPDDYLEWILRSWSLDVLRSSLNFRPILTTISHLKHLDIHNSNPAQVEEQLFQFLTSEVRSGRSFNSNAELNGLRQLYRWCLDECLPGFSEFRQNQLDSLPTRGGASPNFVSMRDDSQGPYTPAELTLIEAKLGACGTALIRQRAQFLLGRDLGLRPVQMALLRVNDFGYDKLGHFIVVTSVKGKRRSRLRRASGNQKKRYISDDTAIAVEEQRKEAPKQAKATLDRLYALEKDRSGRVLEFPMPLFPAETRSDDRLLRFLDSEPLIEYALHADASRLSRALIDLTYLCRIRNQRQDDLDDSGELIKISAYRLRRTLGTSMVLSGCSPEEVQEALDHQSIDTIKHYFRYNPELHNFIDKAHSRSADLQFAVQMWKGLFEEESPSQKSEFKVGSLGKCTLGTACSKHPIVSCYSCPNFRPSWYGNHKEALESLTSFQTAISEASTGPIAGQLDAALVGARAIIRIIEEGENEFPF